MNRRHQLIRTCLVAPLLLATGCDNMKTQPRYDALWPSVFFANGAIARPLPAGTVARGQLRSDELLFSGRLDGKPAEVFPFDIDDAGLQRGRDRYNIFCAVCHDQIGTGNGMIVQRGFTPPPSFHIVRLREAPPGHFFEVMTNGFGAMYGYAERIPPRDRWAIVAYIRALQLSQSATLDDLPAAERARIQEGLR